MDKLVETTIEGYCGNSDVALLITIPKSISWDDYLKEIEAVKDGSKEMNYKVSSKPSKVKPGDKCFVCHDGYIRGWMTISSISRKKFQCSTTGNDWSEAWYVSRSGEFHPLDRAIPQKGFIGYRYINPQVYLMMSQIVRETFDERYQKYLNDYESALCFMKSRLQYIPKEELAYLLATHDKFARIGCAEYAADDNNYGIIKTYSDGVVNETAFGTPVERLPDPLGRKVDTWGRLI